MTVTNSYTNLAPQEYLEAENLSRIEQHYRPREIHQSTISSDAHDTICVNLIALLRNHLRGLGCHVYTGQMKVDIDDQGNTFHYPDVTVTCDERDKNGLYSKQYPSLIMEVTSQETEAFDRGDKFADYRHLTTLQEYVLISQERISVECFRRNAEGNWLFYHFRQGEEVHLASINLRVPIAALYEDLFVSPNQIAALAPKMPPQKPISLSVNPPISYVEPLPPLTELDNQPLTKNLVNNHKLKYNILGLGVVLALSLTGVQAYRFWQEHSMKAKVAASPVNQTNLVASSAVSTPPTPQDLSNKLQIGQGGETGAKTMISLVNRMQKGFYSENERFAAGWEDLGFNILSKTEEYDYQIAWSDKNKAIVTATAKKPELKSYTGVIVVEGESAMDKICETNEASTTAPVMSEVTGKNIKCPAGSSSITGF